MRKCEKKPYLEKITSYSHECPGNDIPQGFDWLENLIQFTGIPPASLLRALVTIADKVENKIYTLALIGPANTGKTLFIKLASVFLRVMKTHIYMYIYIYIFVYF